MRRIDRMPELPEVTRYTKYYEHDGMLRAYANRAMLLAMIFGMLAMGSLGFAVYVRIQRPTVIRVDKDGNALVVGGPRGGKVATISLSADASVGVAPTDLEGRAVIRQFLRRYLAYTRDSVDRNLSEALNMMTANLRVYSMNKLRDEDTVGKIKNDHMISDFEIRSMEHVKGTPWTYTIFGVKEVHRVKNATEATDQIVGRYNVRLVETTRSEVNPSGLLVAEYGEQQMVGDRDAGLLQKSRSLRGTRKLRMGHANGEEGQRFFLAKPGGNNGVPEFSNEFPGEPEAMVESLKTGLSYFVVSEWRGVADFSGKKPQLGREAVRGGPKTGS